MDIKEDQESLSGLRRRGDIMASRRDNILSIQHIYMNTIPRGKPCVILPSIT